MPRKKHHKLRHQKASPEMQLLSLEDLPKIILQAIFSYLGLPDIADLMQVSKTLNAAVTADQQYWKQTIALHFPATYRAYQVPRYMKPGLNWFLRFKHAYYNNYFYNRVTPIDSLWLEPRVRRLLTLIKMGDLPRLQTKEIGFCMTHLQSRQTVLAIAINPNQTLRDYCYNTFILPLFTQNSEIDLAKTDGNNKTIVHWAVLLNQETAIRHFIAEHANCCIIDKDGDLPLNYAIIAGNLKMAHLLIANMSNFLTEDINIFPDYVKSPLCLAVQHEQLDIVKALFAHGMRNSNIFRGIIHDYPFTLAIKSGNHAMVAFLLCHSPETDVNATPKYNYYYGSNGLPAIFYAVMNEDFPMLELLFSRKAHINSTKNSMKTPLGCAVANASYPVAKWLLEHGSNPNISKDPPLPTKAYSLPIDVATETNNLPILKLLLQHKAIVDCYYGHKARYLTTWYLMPDFKKTLNHAELKQLINGIKTTQSIYPCGREHSVRFFQSPHMSLEKTIAAATALKAVVKNKADKTTLKEHHETLIEHEHLMPIYFNLSAP